MAVKMRRSFRDYFPYGCVLDGIRKGRLFDKAYGEILEALEKISPDVRGRIFRTIPYAKSPGIEFTQKYLCVNCDHQMCRFRIKEKNVYSQDKSGESGVTCHGE